LAFPSLEAGSVEDLELLALRRLFELELINPALLTPLLPKPQKGESEMVGELWNAILLLLPLFLLFTLTFGAGFVIGRITKVDKPGM
jgi:hypothetical protein